MSKLEERLEEAYDDLDELDKQFDDLTQDSLEKIDYCINKRRLVCERISLIKKEMKLDEIEGIKKGTTARQSIGTFASKSLNNINL